MSQVDVHDSTGGASTVTGRGSDWHVHPEAELTLLERGQGARHVGDCIAPLTPPELVLIGSNVPHCWDCRGASSGVAVQFLVDHKQPLSATPEWPLISDALSGSSHGLLYPRETTSSVGHLLRQMLLQNPFDRLASFVNILSILRRSQAKTISLKSYSASDTSVHFPAIQRVVQAVLTRYREPIELEQAVAIAQMSRTAFCRDFRNYTGFTFVEYLNEVRVDAISRELLCSDRSISDIAFGEGFSNLSNFNRIFRRIKGMTPREFRAQVKYEKG